MKEEIINKTVEDIRKEEQKKVINEIKDFASVIIDDATENIINSYKTGGTWSRPEYTNNIDDRMYQLFVDISHMFVDKHINTLCFQNANNRRILDYANNYNLSDSDSE